MMDWLSQWLQEIIIIILIATFIELILPSQSMQRYIKVVVSLFILLTLLSPIIALLQKGVEPGSLLGQTPEVETSGTSLSTILQRGESMRVKQEQQAMTLFEDQVQEVLKGELESRFPVRMQEIHLQMKQGDEVQPEINQMQLAIEAYEPETQTSPESKLQTPIESVQPVHIEIRIGESPPLETQNAQQVTSEEERQLENEIKQWIERQWGLEQARIQIRFTNSS